MSVDERVLARRLAQFLAIADQLREDLGPSAALRPRPIHWPRLSGEEQAKELENLRGWVDQLAARFPLLVRLPACWSQHNDLVEILSALRDAEQGCYAETAPPTAPAEWHRILRETELRLDQWMKRLQCGVTTRGHVASKTSALVTGSLSPTRMPKGEAASADADRVPEGLMQ